MFKFKVGDIIKSIPKYHLQTHHFIVVKCGVDNGFDMYYLSCITNHNGNYIKEEYTKDYAPKYFEKVS